MKRMLGILFVLFSLFLLASCNDVEDEIDDNEETIVVPTELEELEFEDMTFFYDGEVKSLPELDLPKGYTAKYYNNEQTEIGKHTVKVIIKNKDGEKVLTLKAKLIIVESDTSIVTPDETGPIYTEPETPTATPDSTYPLEEEHTYHVVGGYHNDWNDYTYDNQMYEISLEELKYNYSEIYSNLETYDIKSIHVYENREFNYANQWEASVYVNGYETYYDGGFTVKVVKAFYDEFDGVRLAEKWNPDPNTSHVGNLTPDMLYMPEWVEVNNGNGCWSDNPVVTAGAGLYNVVFVEYDRANNYYQPGYALGVIKTEDFNEEFESANILYNGYVYDSDYINFFYRNNDLCISYDKSNMAWSAIFFEIPNNFSEYSYLNYSYTFNREHPFIIKLEGYNGAYEQFVTGGSTGYIDLSKISDNVLAGVNKVIIFPAAGMENVSGEILVSQLEFSNVPNLEMKDLYIRGSMNEWACYDDYRLDYNSDGNLQLTTYLDANSEFKIADENWEIDYDYNMLESEYEFFEAAYGNIRVLYSGEYTFTIIDGKIYVEFLVDMLQYEYENLVVDLNNLFYGNEIQLPTCGQTYSNVEITWKSNDNHVIIDENSLLKLEGNYNISFSLTATFKLNNNSMSKTYYGNQNHIKAYKIINNPEENTAYKLIFNQGKLGEVYYLDGTINGRYLSSTINQSLSSDYFVEKESSGMYIYTYIDDVKVYITLGENEANKLSLSYTENRTTLWYLDENLHYLYSNYNDEDYFLGTYNSFTTISASRLSYINEENIGVSQFILQFAILNHVDTSNIYDGYSSTFDVNKEFLIPLNYGMTLEKDSENNKTIVTFEKNNNDYVSTLFSADLTNFRYLYYDIEYYYPVTIELLISYPMPDVNTRYTLDSQSGYIDLSLIDESHLKIYQYITLYPDCGDNATGSFIINELYFTNEIAE